MKNIIKVWLVKNIWSRMPNDFNAEVECDGQIGYERIIDKVFEDGFEADRECALKFIELFNKKVAECTLSGYKVDTGLVTISAEIKSPIINKMWNPDYNSIQMLLEPSMLLNDEIQNTCVNILGEKDEDNENAIKKEEVRTVVDSKIVDRVLLNSNGEVPACGIAFRTWLCKS